MSKPRQRATPVGSQYTPLLALLEGKHRGWIIRRGKNACDHAREVVIGTHQLSNWSYNKEGRGVIDFAAQVDANKEEQHLY